MQASARPTLSPPPAPTAQPSSPCGPAGPPRRSLPAPAPAAPRPGSGLERASYRWCGPQLPHGLLPSAPEGAQAAPPAVTHTSAALPLGLPQATEIAPPVQLTQLNVLLRHPVPSEASPRRPSPTFPQSSDLWSCFLTSCPLLSLGATPGRARTSSQAPLMGLQPLENPWVLLRRERMAPRQGHCTGRGRRRMRTGCCLQPRAPPVPVGTLGQGPRQALVPALRRTGLRPARSQVQRVPGLLFVG